MNCLKRRFRAKKFFRRVFMGVHFYPALLGNFSITAEDTQPRWYFLFESNENITGIQNEHDTINKVRTKF